MPSMHFGSTLAEVTVAARGRKHGIVIVFPVLPPLGESEHARESGLSPDAQALPMAAGGCDSTEGSCDSLEVLAEVAVVADPDTV